MRRHRMLLSCSMLALAVASGPDSSAIDQASRWSLLRVVERSLQGTAGVVRGVGDAIAVSTGGTIKMVGGSMQQMGGGIEGLSDAVEGEQDSKDVSDAIRSVASRPVRVIGRLVRSLGDTTSFIGDSTEKVAAEAMGIFPDTINVVESSVRTLRSNLGNTDTGEDSLDDAEGSVVGGSIGSEVTPTGLRLRRLEEGEGAAGANGLAPRNGRSGLGASPTRDTKLDGRHKSRLRAPAAAGQQGLHSHLLLALGAVALGARSSSGVSLLLLVLLALLYLSRVDAARREGAQRGPSNSDTDCCTLYPVP